MYLFVGKTPNRNDTIRTCDPCFPKAVLYQTELHSVVVVPIASIPELPRGMQQLSGPNRNNYTTSCAPCQMVPSAPIHNDALPTFPEWEQIQEEIPSPQDTMEFA